MKELTKTAEKSLVAPRSKSNGARAEKGSLEYNILKWSLDQREDREWYPAEDPDAFVVRKFDSPWKKGEHGWFIVFGEHEKQFSYLKGFNPSRMSRVSAAARREVSSQVIAVARRGEHVHHAGEPFAALLKRWMRESQLTPDDIEVFDDGTMGNATFSDDLGKLWRDFHAKNALLVRMSADDHKALHAKRTNIWQAFIRSIVKV